MISAPAIATAVAIGRDGSAVWMLPWNRISVAVPVSGAGLAAGPQAAARSSRVRGSITAGARYPTSRSASSRRLVGQADREIDLQVARLEAPADVDAEQR